MWQWKDMFYAQNPEYARLTLDEDDPLYYASEAIQNGVWQAKAARAMYFPDALQKQALYYSLPKNERRGYLNENQDLKEYWDWWHDLKDNNPDLEAYLGKKEDAFVKINADQIADAYLSESIDFDSFSQELLWNVYNYHLTGEKLPRGAQDLLYEEWVRAGKPGTFDRWVEAMRYEVDLTVR